MARPIKVNVRLGRDANESTLKEIIDREKKLAINKRPVYNTKKQTDRTTQRTNDGTR